MPVARKVWQERVGAASLAREGDEAIELAGIAVQPQKAVRWFILRPVGFFVRHWVKQIFLLPASG